MHFADRADTHLSGPMKRKGGAGGEEAACDICGQAKHKHSGAERYGFYQRAKLFVQITGRLLGIPLDAIEQCAHIARPRPHCSSSVFVLFSAVRYPIISLECVISLRLCTNMCQHCCAQKMPLHCVCVCPGYPIAATFGACVFGSALIAKNNINYYVRCPQFAYASFTKTRSHRQTAILSKTTANCDIAKRAAIAAQQFPNSAHTHTHPVSVSHTRARSPATANRRSSRSASDSRSAAISSKQSKQSPIDTNTLRPNRSH